MRLSGLPLRLIEEFAILFADGDLSETIQAGSEISPSAKAILYKRTENIATSVGVKKMFQYQLTLSIKETR